MPFTACSMLIAVTMAGSPAGPIAAAPRTVEAVAAEAAAPQGQPLKMATMPAAPAAWTMDREERRPALLPAMYASLGALNVFDVYSTRRAMSAGAREANPVMRSAGGSGAMLAVKALSTAGTIYFAERAWKKNRKGAVVLMAAINGATAAIAMRNVRNAR